MYHLFASVALNFGLDCEGEKSDSHKRWERRVTPSLYGDRN
jgi:hypothetical protein